MPRRIRVDGALVQKGMYTYLPLPPERTVGLSGRYVPARISLNGVTAVVTLHRDGTGYRAALARAVRDAAGGVGHGARVIASVEILDEPPPVDVPDDVAAALGSAPAAAAVFEAITPAHRRHIVEWITTAKRPQTRAKRIGWLATSLPGMNPKAGWTER